MLIEQPSKWLRWIYPKALWRINPEERAVYLTFDDGPIPESTPFILDTLKEYDAKATFFMVGENVKRHPDLYQRIVEEGHQVGNHTYNHMGSLKHYIVTYYNNVEKANEVIHSHLFRPPHGWMWFGAYNMLRRKYKIVMWDLVTRDYSHLLNAFDVLRNVVLYARNGSIITFHDSLKSIEKLRYALPASLRYLKEQGYEFKVIE
ncbi:MAG: polysaccharide deacetylase family protein [Prevotella sp.]|jgi:peptidoglycan/xylan/chitin deacetylase (PgdA/CDA1 family)|nr:polysaccharide deacetylase family protein [Prevotella sp.]MBR4276445.1 polysaccharide deacetylase family protein [Prevotella sp.]